MGEEHELIPPPPPVASQTAPAQTPPTAEPPQLSEPELPPPPPLPGTLDPMPTPPTATEQPLTQASGETTPAFEQLATPDEGLTAGSSAPAEVSEQDELDVPPPPLPDPPASLAVPSPRVRVREEQIIAAEEDAADLQGAEVQQAGELAGNEPTPESSQEEPQLPTMVAYYGVLTMPPVHSICSLELRPEVDEITPALAMFSKLQPGEKAFIRFSVRPAEAGTRGKLQAMLTRLQAGESIAGVAGPSGFKAHASMWVRYLLEMLAYLLMGQARGAEPPVPPWKAEAALTPRPMSSRPEEEKMAMKFAEQKVQSGTYFESRLWIGAISDDPERAQALDKLVQEIQQEFSNSYSNTATNQGFTYRKADPLEAAIGMLPVERSQDCILTPPELGEMMKVPDRLTKTQAVDVDYGMRAKPPRRPIIVPDPLNPPPGIIAFGEIWVGSNRQTAVGMPIAGLNTHMYVCGTTGSGKSTLTEWFIYGLAKQGKSVFVIDPHGTLVDNVLPTILAFAPERAKDILVLDFGDAEWPVSFNPIAIDSANEIEGTVNSVREMILKMLNLNPDAAPRAVNYTEQAVWALCEANIHALSGHKHLALTLLQVPTFFTDPEFRRLVMQFCTNLAIRETFDPDGPFEQLGSRAQLDHVLPVLRTFSQLATKDSFGNIFGQSESKIDFAQWVRTNKIVLMKLPAIASDVAVSTFIGAMVTPMLIGSLSQWKDDPNLSAYLIIDEFQNYATESFKALLAQTRKHGLHGIAINQVPQDLPPDVLRGVQSNTQTKFTMRLDPVAVREIAHFIASGEDHPRTDDILALPNYWGWVNHMLDNGEASGPYVFRGLAPPLARDANGEPIYPYHPNGAKDIEEAEKRVEELLPQVLANSRLASAQPRDKVWEQRQSHLKEVRQVLEHKIHERAREGGYDGASHSSTAEEIFADAKGWENAG